MEVMYTKKMKPFPNPPIREAIFDIRVVLSLEVSLENLASYQEGIKERFPIKEERVNWESGLQLKPGSVPEIIPPSGGAYGFFFRSEKEKKIVQARRDGFTFNKLKPYEKWEVFFAEARELWQHYLEVVKPSQVTRVALRYINCIEIPLPIKEFKEYILTIPEIAPGIPQSLNRFFMQLVIPKNEIEAIANVTVTIDPVKPEKDILPLILDIDVFRNIALPPSDPKIFEIMTELREYKNLIFVSSVTSKCKELFK